jgi:hypothetical protein
MKINRAWYVMLVVLAMGSMAVLYAFAPGEYSFYPRCYFYVMTGLQCPGCGGLRATHSLLHGDFRGAFAYNPLLTSLIPAVAAAAVWVLFHRAAGKPLRWPIKPLCLWLLLGVSVVFAVVRNLPAAFLL